MAFVLVQHLSPPHKSILPELVQRYTAMPVSLVTDGIQVQPNCVYVIPPGRNLAFDNGRLNLLTPEQETGGHLTIDFFFRTLAQEQGERAIGIVLSGSGSDGSQGLKNIKAEGGLAIAQDPDTAAFPDMPRNAIASLDVDYVLPPQKMGSLLLKYVRHQAPVTYKQNESSGAISNATLQSLYQLIRNRTGHDLSLYKQNTIWRRIDRRMKINQVKNLDEYTRYLQKNPEETDALFRELLINVTSFFRDPEYFAALAEKVIHPLLISKIAENLPLRVWVAACSTGEEAYSIAILIQEQMEALNGNCKVQIYATDLAEDTVTTARLGIYSESIRESVSAERLERFFNKEDHVYQIKKTIRDLVVFAPQNLISDPPFSKIDLISCRNLLIYLMPELQKQLFSLFHYALNPKGVLFLGNSESISNVNDLFAVIDRKHKIFERKEVKNSQRRPAVTQFVPPPVFVPHSSDTEFRNPAVQLQKWLEKTLLEYYTPSCVIVDGKYNIQFIHGHTGKYLEPAQGETSTNLLDMAREGLKTDLLSTIHRSMSRHEMVKQTGIKIKTNGDQQLINLTVRPVEEVPELTGLFLVVFEESRTVLAEGDKKEPGKTAPDRRIAEFEQALKDKEEYLQSIIDEVEATNLDLKGTNEELLSSNEELQSTNEELETSKEELQSVNEELTTVNTELQKKNEELDRLNNDMYNLLSSTEIGTIFLDLDLKIRRFTPSANRIYNFMATDIGRPIGHFVSNLEYDHLAEDIQQVVNSLVPKAIEIQAKHGAWYLVNIKPYRTLENVIDGVVVTFVDVSAQKRSDELRRMGTIIRDSNDAITLQDSNGKFLSWNRGATQMYGWSEAEAIKMNSFDLIPEDMREESRTLYQRLLRGELIRSFETKRISRNGRILDVWMTLTTIADDSNHPIGIATTERDITDRKRATQRLSYENRALLAVTQFYQDLLESPRTQSLADVACRILVEKSEYRLAWFGQVQPNKPIEPDICIGREEGELEPSEAGWVLQMPGRKAVENALRSRRPVVIRHIQTELDPGSMAG